MAADIALEALHKYIWGALYVYTIGLSMCRYDLPYRLGICTNKDFEWEKNHIGTEIL